MDDKRIIELYTDRSEAAIAATSEKYGRYCHSIARGILGSDKDAEECVNDAYLRAWSSIPPMLPDCLRSFLGKITRNLALNRLEAHSAEKRGAGQVPLVLDELAECVPSGENADRTLDDMVIRDAINGFLAELSPETRKLFVRRYWYMSSVSELAAEYGLSESKVTVTLFRTRAKLKKALEKEGISL